MEGDRGSTIEEGSELFHRGIKEAFPSPPYEINSTRLGKSERRESHNESIGYQFRVTDPRPLSRHINFFPTDEFLARKNESPFEIISEQAFDYAKDLFNSISEKGLIKNIILWGRVKRS